MMKELQTKIKLKTIKIKSFVTTFSEVEIDKIRDKQGTGYTWVG